MGKKRIFSVLFAFLIFASTICNTYAEPQSESQDNSLAPHAAAALLMDLKSGKILFEKNIDDMMYPASTTKIMTAILVLENDNLEDMVTAQKEAIEPITMQHSNMGILVGEEISVNELLYGMLVYSANDAANVLAVHTSGSIEAFATLMNQKAQELGCKNTNFVNPHGFHDPGHYTTAGDLAIISRYAMQNEKFREYVSTDMYVMQPTNKYHEIRYLSNTNYLVSNKRRAEYYYKKAIGIKTGYTDEAGSCLVSAAKDGDTEFLAVVMNCKNTTMELNGAYSFVDSRQLLEHGFNNYKYITVVPTGDMIADSSVYEAKDDVRVAITPSVDISALLPKDMSFNDIKTETVLIEKISAPIEKGDVLGTIKCTYKGEEIGTAEVVALNSVEKDYVLATIHLFVKIITHPVFLILVALFIYVRFRAAVRRKKKRMMRRKRLEHVSDNPDYYNSRRERK